MIIVFQLNMQRIQEWLYEHNRYMEKVSEFIIDQLETGSHKFRLCFYDRDWLIGVPIAQSICRSVEDSRRIIILLTKNFLESSWGRLKFRLAIQDTSNDKCKRLIVIRYPDGDSFDDLDSELKIYMTLNTYLDRNDADFWNKLIYAMPHNSRNLKVSGTGQPLMGENPNRLGST